MCRPYAAAKLVRALKEETALPVHFHTHDTSGIAAASVLAASDATGLRFVDLLEQLWEIDPGRIAQELGGLGVGGPLAASLGVLTDDERASVVDFAAFLAARHGGTGRRPTHR